MEILMSGSIDKISSALLEAQKKMGKALKDSNNPHFKSSYADINSVIDTVIPTLNDEDISVWQPTVEVGGRKYVKTLFLHSSGQFLAGLTEIIHKDETNPQQQVAAITYARRAGLQSMAAIGGEDDDGQTATGKSVKEKSTKSDKPSRFSRTKKTEKVEEVESSNEVEEEEVTVESEVEQEEKPTPSKTSFRRFTRGNK